MSLIVFEGIDGAGKTTQIDLLKQYHLCKDWVFTRNPGGTRIGELIRGILLNDKHESLADECELMLYAADRAQCTKTIIMPAIDAGRTVVCDRFSDSTVAYQGYGRGLNISTMNSLNELATYGVKPKLTIILDVDPAVALARLGSSPDRIESAGYKFMSAVRQGYLSLAKAKESCYKVIEANNKNAADVHNKVLTTLIDYGILKI